MMTLVSIFCFNEGVKMRHTLERFPEKREYDILVMDDGSTDNSTQKIDKEFSLKLLTNERNRGIGFSMKKVFNYSLEEGYEVIVIMAGNNKDNPLEIPKLLKAINAGYDFVQGSRFLEGGGFGNMPFYRVLATRIIHPFLFSLFAKKRFSDTTNGFRALRTCILRDAHIKWKQNWLDRYELEPYLFLKSVNLGYRVKEVPVSKIYPSHNLGYTKMKPIVDWWRITKPLFWVGFKIRK